VLFTNRRLHLAIATLCLGGASKLAADREPELIVAKTLSPAGHADGETLFSELKPARTGLGDFQNNYSNPELWTRRWHEYLHGPIGTGVSVGDVNGDALADLYVVSKDETSRLFINQGGFRFSDGTAQAGLVDSPDPASGSSFADVDNDGDLDLYLCLVKAPNQLWINDGNGKFEEAAETWGVAASGGANMSAFSDYDLDGDLDLYLQNNLVQRGTAQLVQADRLFENVGGRFEEVSDRAGISGEATGHAAVWLDFNDDRYPDLYIANDYAYRDRLYRNNQDGTFTDVLDALLPAIPHSSMGFDFGDLNNDGLVDLWATDMETADRDKRMQTSLDLVISHANTKTGQAFQYEKNALLLQTHEGGFLDVAFLAGLARTEWTWAARLADLDCDGWIDAFSTNGMIRKLHYKDMGLKRMQMSGPNKMPRLFRNGEPLNERNYAYQNQRDLRFSDRSADWGLDKLGVSFGAAFGDLDGDGDLDIVVNNFQEPPSVYRNNEAESNRLTLRLVGTLSNRFGIGAKAVLKSGELAQTKRLFPNRGYISSDQPILHFGLGARTSVDELEIHWPSGIRQRLEDLPANAHYQITEAESGTPASEQAPPSLYRARSAELPAQAERRENFHNSFSAQPLLPFEQSRKGGAILSADVDQDGAQDLILSGAAGQSTAILGGTGKGDAFADITPFEIEDDFISEDTDLLLGDFDADGDLDLAVASGSVEFEAGDSAYADRIYTNQDGVLSRDWDQPFPAHPTRSLSAADYDGDGDLDLLALGDTRSGKYPHAYPTTLWTNQAGAFTATEEDRLALPAASAGFSDSKWADIDNDGDLDLVLAGEWGPPLLMTNKRGTLSPYPSAFDADRHSGLWSAVSIADLDGDGFQDIVLGNLGLNADYEASPESPLALWHTRDHSQEVQLMEVQEIDGLDWPLREKWLVERGFPITSGQSATNAEYAAKTVQDILSPAMLETMDRARVNELRSGVFWGSADGSFAFQALPPLAQAGRMIEILIVDADGDGSPDLVASLQPQFPDPWSGDVEDGLVGLILNRGNRTFEALLPKASGLEIKGSPRGLAWADLDGDGQHELLVTVSNGSPQLFEKSSNF